MGDFDQQWNFEYLEQSFLDGSEFRISRQFCMRVNYSFVSKGIFLITGFYQPPKKSKTTVFGTGKSWKTYHWNRSSSRKDLFGSNNHSIALSAKKHTGSEQLDKKRCVQKQMMTKIICSKPSRFSMVTKAEIYCEDWWRK